MQEKNQPAVSKQHIEKLQMIDITKQFPGVLANDKVNLEVNAGEILALLGENGAGKSTLMKQLYGLYKPDSGQILINGKEQVFNSPNRCDQRRNRNDSSAFHAGFESNRLENISLWIKIQPRSVS